MLNDEEKAMREAALAATQGKWCFDGAYEERPKKFSGITIETYQPNWDYIKPIIQTDGNFYGPKLNDALHILASQPQAVLRVLERLEEALNLLGMMPATPE